MALNTNKKEGDKLHAEEWNELVQEVQRKQSRLNIVDALDSTSSADVLSAKQGKILNDKINSTLTSVETISKEVDKFPTGYYYGRFDSVNSLPDASQLTQKGYAYVASEDASVCYIYLFNGEGSPWEDSGNKFVTTELETNLNTKSQTKAPTTKAVADGIESIDLMIPRSQEQENELTQDQKFNASSNINNRIADTDQVTGKVKAFGYKILDKNKSLNSQVNQNNFVYEVRDCFEGTIQELNIPITTSKVISGNRYWYGEGITIETGKALLLNYQTAGLNSSRTSVSYKQGTGKVIVGSGTTYYPALTDIDISYKLDGVANTVSLNKSNIPVINEISYLISSSTITIPAGKEILTNQTFKLINTNNEILETTRSADLISFTNNTDSDIEVYIAREAYVKCKILNVIEVAQNSEIYFNGGSIKNYCIKGSSTKLSGKILFNADSCFAGIFDTDGVDPRWFGAIPTTGDTQNKINYNNSEDAAPAFNAALGLIRYSTRGYLYIPSGLWSLKSAIRYQGFSAVKIKGETQISSILQIGPMDVNAVQYYPVAVQFSSDTASVYISDIYVTGGDLHSSFVHGTAFDGLNGAGTIRNVKAYRIGILFRGEFNRASLIDNIYASNLSYSFFSKATEWDFKDSHDSIMMDGTVSNCYINSMNFQDSESTWNRICFNGNITTTRVTNNYIDYWAVIFSTPKIASEGIWFGNIITNNHLDLCLRFNTPTGLYSKNSVITSNLFTNCSKYRRDHSNPWSYSTHPDKSKKVAFITLLSSQNVTIANNRTLESENILAITTIRGSNAKSSGIVTDFPMSNIRFSKAFNPSSPNIFTTGTAQLTACDGIKVYDVISGSDSADTMTFYLNIYALVSRIRYNILCSMEGSSFIFGNNYYPLFFKNTTRKANYSFYYEEVSSVVDCIIQNSNGVESSPLGISYPLVNESGYTTEQTNGLIAGCYRDIFTLYYKTNRTALYDDVYIYNLGVRITFKDINGIYQSCGFIKSCISAEGDVSSLQLPFIVETLPSNPLVNQVCCLTTYNYTYKTYDGEKWVNGEEVGDAEIVEILPKNAEAGDTVRLKEVATMTYKRYTYSGWSDEVDSHGTTRGEMPIKNRGYRKYLPNTYHSRYLTIGCTYYNPATGITYTLEKKTNIVDNWKANIGNVESLEHPNGYNASTNPITYAEELIEGELVMCNGKLYVWGGQAWKDTNGNYLNSIQVSDKSVLLEAAADSTNNVEVYTNDTPTISVKNPDNTNANSWLSASLNGTTLTITATANTSNNPRGGKVILTNTSYEVVINVVQNYV